MFKVILLVICLIVGYAAAAPTGTPIEMEGGEEFAKVIEDLESSLSDEQRQQIKTIFTNESLTKQQIQDHIKEYFEKIGGDSLTKFNDFQSTLKTKIDEMIKKVEDVTKNMSDDAKQAVSQIKEIKENMSLTLAQDREQTKAILDKAPEEVKTELKALKGIFGDHEEELGF